MDTTVYSPVCLPPRSADYTGKTGWVLGWGRLSEGGQLATVLQELELLIVDDATCSAKMSGMTSAAEQLCAGGGGRQGRLSGRQWGTFRPRQWRTV